MYSEPDFFQKKISVTKPDFDRKLTNNSCKKICSVLEYIIS